MIYIAYSIILWLAAPLIVAYHCYRSVSRKRPAALAERFGFVGKETLAPLADSEVIWVHAVSVGETIAAIPLLKALRQRWPEHKILLSNVTETGREVAEKLAEVDCRLYFPFDYRFAVKRMLRLVKPSLIIVVETEIWPNFLRSACTANIPVVMVNGRISDKSARRYLKLGWFFGPVLANFTALCMQSREDARRITAIGAEAVTVHVTGNLKYDVPVARLAEQPRRSLRESYGIPASSVVFCAGSTHAGEDEAVIEAFKAVAADADNVILVIAPRHPERAPAVADILKGSGIPFVLRSAMGTGPWQLLPGEALLVDTIGELKLLLSLSDVVFIGGSLVPTGGHNVLEPASFGLPVLFGPHMSNFREISASILVSGGAIQIEDGAGLEEHLRRLCFDPERRLAMGDSGMAWLRESSGAVERHMEVIERIMGSK